MIALLIAAAFARGETLYVSAAASLKESFTEISRTFERSHPGVRVELSFAGSQQLAAQIVEGAPCDVFASADMRTMARIQLKRTGSKVFAKNLLVLVSGYAQPKLGLKDLDKVHSLVLAAPQVPAGGYALEVFDSASKRYGSKWLAGVKGAVVSQEPDVRSVLAKIQLKEADAGIVYRTDAKSANGKVFTFPIDKKYQPVIEYPIGVPNGTSDSKLAGEFVSFVLGKSGQEILREDGFGGK